MRGREVTDGTLSSVLRFMEAGSVAEMPDSFNPPEFKAKLLNVGPIPAAGDFNTVNSNAYIATRDEYKVTMLPASCSIFP